MTTSKLPVPHDKSVYRGVLQRGVIRHAAIRVQDHAGGRKLPAHRLRRHLG
jgi:hypothetical protein